LRCHEKSNGPAARINPAPNRIMQLSFLVRFSLEKFFLILKIKIPITIRIPVYTRVCGAEKKLSGWLKI
jgi:hypothetical protein